jgi:hypothetical protein
MTDLENVAWSIAHLVSPYFEFDHQREDFEREVYAMLKDVRLAAIHKAAARARAFDASRSDIHTVVQEISDSILQLGAME